MILKPVKFISALISLGLAAGCAAPARSPFVKFVDLRAAERSGNAETLLPDFVGKYRVVDSRANPSKVDTVEISLIAGVPAMRLWRSGGAEPVAELQANDCKGDFSNQYSKNAYVFCMGIDPSGDRAPFFSVSRIVHPEVHKSGSLIPTYEAMPVSSGYLFRYELVGRYEPIRALAAIKEEGGK